MARMKQKKKPRIRIFRLLLLLFILLTAVILFDSYSRIVTTEYELEYSSLPDSFNGFRIVVLSDIHAAVFGSNNKRLIENVIRAKPDIIAITGDFIDNSNVLSLNKQLAIAEKLVKELILIAPIYYVTGNHEWDGGVIWDLLPLLQEHDVTVLRNRYTHIERSGESIIIAGTDDPNGPADMIKPGEFVGRIDKTEDKGFVVMLEHRNNRLPLYSELGIELLLCGHAHGGIIRLPFTDGLIGPMRELFPTYTNGLYTMGDTNMLVSRGIGNHTGVPRFLNNPHIVVAVLRKG